MTKELIIGSALLALATSAVAQAPSKAPTSVTRAQVMADLNAAFARVDTNKDGTINVAEVDAAQQRTLAEEAAQIVKNTEAQFTQLDKDKNGQLSLAEFKGAMVKPKVASGQSILQLLDANKDGKISAAEFNAQRLSQFDRVDTNHDGIVTQTEMQAAAAR